MVDTLWILVVVPPTSCARSPDFAPLPQEFPADRAGNAAGVIGAVLDWWIVLGPLDAPSRDLLVLETGVRRSSPVSRLPVEVVPD